MKKLSKILIVAVVLSAMFISLTACVFSSLTPYEKVVQAFERLDEAYAVDMITEVSSTSDSSTQSYKLSIKLIDKEDAQAVHISMEHSEADIDSDSYFIDGRLYSLSQDKSEFFVSEVDFEDYLRTGQIVPTTFDIDELFNGVKITKKYEKSLEKYSFSVKNTEIEKIIKENGLDDPDLKGSFDLSIWLDRSDSSLKKIEYAMAFYYHETDIKVNVGITINALNENVKIDIPQILADEIERQKSLNILTLAVSPANAGYAIGGGSYSAGDSVYVDVSSSYGYRFVGWYDGDELVSESYYFNFEMPNKSYKLTARFEQAPVQYSINLGAMPYDYGYVSGAYNAYEGDLVTVTATAYSGYVFLGWYDSSNVKVSSQYVYSFEMPAASLSLNARFGEYVEDYKNTADNAVKYYFLDDYVDVVFDKATDKFVVLRHDCVEIYDSNFENKTTLSFLITPKTIDADNGVLAIGFGYSNQIHLYNLYDVTETKKVQTNYNVFELVMDGDMIIYTGNNQWCEVRFYNFVTDTQVSVHALAYNPLLDINRDKHVVYLAETGISSSALMYFNSQTGEQLFEAESYQFGYNSSRPFFNGKYVNYYQSLFDSLTGQMVSSTRLNRHYSKLKDFEPTVTILESDDLSLIAGIGDNSKLYVGVYQNAAEKFVYKYEYEPSKSGSMGQSKFFSQNQRKCYVSIIDTSKIPDSFEGNIETERARGTISEADGITTLNHFETYTLYAADENNIYLLNEDTFTLTVYDKFSLDEVYYERLLMKPACVDAYSGKLVIGFGNGRVIRVYNVSDWSSTSISALECVYSIAFYNDTIFYMPIDQHCGLYAYSLKTNKHIDGTWPYFSAYYATTAINREDGILYIGSRNSSSCDLFYFDMQNMSVLYQSAWGQYSYNSNPISFDGEFVHFAGKSLHKKSGLVISNTNKVHNYVASGYSDIETIHHTNSISVFTAKKGGKACSAVYDLSLNKVILELDEVVKSVHITEGYYVLFYGTSLIQFVPVA